MKFKNNFLSNFLKEAPVPLALERSLECAILSKQEFIHPILDIGCGEGLFASILFDEKIDVGIDPDERELKRSKDYNIYNELIKCYGNEIPKPSNSFNTIFSNSVLEHIPNIEPVLKEAHRLLADDGNFYITAPTNLFDQYSIVNQILICVGLKNAAAKYRKFFNSFWKHYHYYDKKNWQKLFEQNEFRVINAIEYGNKRTCTINDSLAPFSFVSFLIKKTVNKWTLSPFLRTVFTWPVKELASLQNSNKIINIENGGLIFFHLKKNT